ncbi:helix-turn-helix domain-containing protein [Clostridium sp. CF012]|uniref:helix-turn-helix domain-containing protein n=1 Tax=Clostridium sp. CF012 TaxID=2843319 RepID=UPI001C0E6F89|nr:helix-turn-helix transcriptional regulator [Clostridium sp. CF012]MBU3145593.1 helix-turn-helix domain-containing protein [Clostridium sp. CF012]
MQFNERFRALRQDKDLTQDVLAKELNIDRKTLSNYETAYRTPSIYLVVKIADYFNVSTDYLLGRTDIADPYPKIHE